LFEIAAPAPGTFADESNEVVVCASNVELVDYH
jgi:hypothetical protein